MFRKKKKEKQKKKVKKQWKLEWENIFSGEITLLITKQASAAFREKLDLVSLVPLQNHITFMIFCLTVKRISMPLKRPNNLAELLL